VAIHLIEFDVHGTDVPTWRAAGAAFAGRVAAACATPTSLAG
jgi:hypothetical protein